MTFYQDDFVPIAPRKFSTTLSYPPPHPKKKMDKNTRTKKYTHQLKNNT